MATPSQHLITRREWGARYQDGTRDRVLPVEEWWAHHSVTIAPDLVAPFDDDDAAIRTLERIGEQRFSTGISYTFPITPVGRCYQGHSMHRVGSHTRGHNTIGAAIVFVGDYSTKRPTAAAQEAAARRMVIEHRAGRAKTHRFNGGHTQASLPEGGTANTACPGAGVLAVLPDINRRADELWAAGYGKTTSGSGGSTSTPIPTPTPTPQEADMPITDEEVAKIADAAKRAVWGSTVGKDTTGQERTAGFAQGATFRDGQRQSVQIAGLETVLSKMVDLLQAQAAGFELPSKAEILAQVRAAADARFGQLTFDNTEEQS